MKFIPILFSTPMIQAIMEDRKTMTRRIAAVPVGDHFGTDIMDWGLSEHPHLEDGIWGYTVQTDVDDSANYRLKNKYGKPGDILWVRETWRGIEQDFGGPRYEFRATEKIDMTSKWKPSIFMPKAACRIFLEVTDVRVERLQDISQEDAKAEGVFPAPHRCPGWKNPLLAFKDCYKCAFKLLWDRINGRIGHQWDKNEWVWVVSFKRIEKPKNFGL